MYFGYIDTLPRTDLVRERERERKREDGSAEDKKKILDKFGKEIDWTAENGLIHVREI